MISKPRKFFYLYKRGIKKLNLSFDKKNVSVPCNTIQAEESFENFPKVSLSNLFNNFDISPVFDKFWWKGPLVNCNLGSFIG